MSKNNQHPATPAQEQPDTSVRVSPELKATLDAMKGEQESYGDVIRRLTVTKTIADLPEDGIITLKIPVRSYRTLFMAVGQVPGLCDMLAKARVPG